ncbi:LysR family transcriptional regulator [Vreelandella zhaodongensis]|uniref:LysR family transcriptional regulator n=1 Tax=Vreelandella zhaodongensis TaxID=1176240 RepID=A0ABX2SV14_VREZH|nr:LysR family transcriptional regulator [Halomonas zhaodongensis]NYS46005.1 LysR family transcriptional regulator [Halomonas zhaodongensis]
MEFRQLRYFIAVVESGSLSAASQRVHVAQPALTRQIRLLEENLATQLFNRHARGMRLTVAGQVLYEEALELLDRREKLKARLSAIGQGAIGKVSLGVTMMHLWLPQVAALLGDYRKRFPRVTFEISPLLSGSQLEWLRQGRLDAGILYLGETTNPGLGTQLIHLDHLVLAVPEGSGWADNPPQCLAELEEEDFIRGFRSASPIYYDYIQEHFQRLGFNPRVVQYGADNITILSMVAAGLGSAILPSDACHHPLPGIRVLTLPELDVCDMPLWFAWRKESDSPALHNLIELVINWSK